MSKRLLGELDDCYEVTEGSKGRDEERHGAVVGGGKRKLLGVPHVFLDALITFLCPSRTHVQFPAKLVA